MEHELVVRLRDERHGVEDGGSFNRRVARQQREEDLALVVAVIRVGRVSGRVGQVVVRRIDARRVVARGERPDAQAARRHGVRPAVEVVDVDVVRHAGRGGARPERVLDEARCRRRAVPLDGVQLVAALEDALGVVHAVDARPLYTERGQLRADHDLRDVHVHVERGRLERLDAAQLDFAGELHRRGAVPFGVVGERARLDGLHRRRQRRREGEVAERRVERARADVLKLVAEREAREARRVAERRVADVRDGREGERPRHGLVVVERPGGDLDDRPLVVLAVHDGLREVERAAVGLAVVGQRVRTRVASPAEHERPVGGTLHGHVERVGAVGHRDVARCAGQRPVRLRGEREYQRGERAKCAFPPRDYVNVSLHELHP